MKNALEIRGLTRKYEGFALDSVNLTLPRGCVMGLVGENGAGKTTLIKTVLDLVRPDSGEIEVLGGRADDAAVRERIGAVLEDGGFLSTMNAAQVDTLLGRAYRAWDGAQFASYLDRFGIDRRKAIKDYSRGMKMKLSIAAALSHGAELLILDEATSGLDPVVRDEVLDLLYDFMQDESHAVLLSSHITSDLDKIADNITFIHHGRVLLSEGRDELIPVLAKRFQSQDYQDRSLVRLARIRSRRGRFFPCWMVLNSMEHLTKRFAAMLDGAVHQDTPPAAFRAEYAVQYENLLVYFLFRYALKSVNDRQFAPRVLSCAFHLLCLRELTADAADVQTFAAIVSLYSKEVEHSADNLQLLQKLFRRGTLTWQYLMAILDA